MMPKLRHQHGMLRAAGFYTAAATAALICALSLLLALAWFGGARAAGAVQAVAPETVLALVEADVEQVLGVDVALEPLRPLPALSLAQGALELSVRYPGRAGLFLPEAVECRVDGRLVTSLPLGQYLRFRLQVLTAPQGVAARTLIDPAGLACEEQLLGAGTEVVTLPEQAAGLMAQGSIAPGVRLQLSRLMRPYDVLRGASVRLVIVADGVRLEARAKALADGYTGQRLTVEREGDRVKYTGIVAAGNQVVVE